MGTKYVVTAPYVTFKTKAQSGGIVLREMYQGGTLPDDAEPDNVERLLEKKMIASVGSEEADLLGAPAGSPIPGEPPNVPVTEQSPAAVSQEARLDRAKSAVEDAQRRAVQQSADDGDDGKPKASDDKPTWLQYRVNERVQQRPEDMPEEQARVQAQAELEGKSKADLVAGR